MRLQNTSRKTANHHLLLHGLLLAAACLSAAPVFGEQRWTMRRQGNYLVVAAPDYVGSAPLNQFIAAKTAQGFNVTTYAVPSGTTRQTIRSYIQSLWGTVNAPDYVLLVGDTDGSTSTSATIPYWTGGGSKQAPTDLPYVCMDAGDDWYPDLAIGRWSCRTTAQLQAIVDKSLYVEAGVFDDPDYYKRGAFLANPDTNGQAEPCHDWVIENLLEPAEYEGIRIYAAQGGSTQHVTNAINNGVLFTVYMGHSGSSGWWSPSFYQGDVNNLTNAGKYCLVCGWSCNTSNYPLGECFGETWLRAANKGAIAYISASTYIYWGSAEAWRPSVELEKGFFRAMFEDGIWEVGPAWHAGLYHFLETFGEWDGNPSHPPSANLDICRNFFEEFVVLGEPSLLLPGGWYIDVYASPFLHSVCVPAESQVTYNLEVGGQGNFSDPVALSVVGLPAGAIVDFSVNNLPPPFSSTMTISNLSGVPVGTYNIKVNAVLGDMTASRDIKLAVSNDVPGPLVPLRPRDYAMDVSRSPALRWLAARQAAEYAVQVALDADFQQMVYETEVFGTSHALNAELDADTTHYWRVRALNACETGEWSATYRFTTIAQADPFTEQFDADFDLQYQSLTFIPDDSGHCYAVCREQVSELPVNVSNGTVLYLADDAYGTVQLPAGQTVPFFGTQYGAYCIGSNGYVTFTGGDVEKSATPSNHFRLPRIAGLFDDLNPAYGQVRFKHLSDRAVVGYLGVPEHGTSNASTFEIEMFFDGRIRLTWLNVAATGAIVGLSRGGGVPDGYLESDLSGYPVCDWSTPPVAQNLTVQAVSNEPLTVELPATDDGMPQPPALDYVIVTLPLHGTLRDPAAGAIADVPYTLVGGGNQVEYLSDHWYVGLDVFAFKANDGGTPPAGGDSNIAATLIEVSLPQPRVIYGFPLDTDPGWTTEGQWAFGQPTGGGTHNYDPTSGYTGPYVYGYNLNGDYGRNMPMYCLTTGALNCSTLLGTTLRFQRWLGVERAPFDRAGIQISNNGIDWIDVWQNPTVTIADQTWILVAYDLAPYADGQATVYLRWTMGPTDASTTYPGWNIDDIEIVAIDLGPNCPGDLDGNGFIDLGDLAQLLANYGITAGAAYDQGDLDRDGDVDLADLAALLGVYGTECP